METGFGTWFNKSIENLHPEMVLSTETTSPPEIKGTNPKMEKVDKSLTDECEKKETVQIKSIIISNHL